jgi:hypothetical protein
MSTHPHKPKGGAASSLADRRTGGPAPRHSQNRDPVILEAPVRGLNLFLPVPRTYVLGYYRSPLPGLVLGGLVLLMNFN